MVWLVLSWVSSGNWTFPPLFEFSQCVVLSIPEVVTSLLTDTLSPQGTGMLSGRSTTVLGKS